MGNIVVGTEDMKKMAAEIRKGGIPHLLTVVRDETRFNALKASLHNAAVRSALVHILMAEGRRLLAAHKKSGKPPSEIGKLSSKIGTMLADPELRTRLRKLMETEGGRKVVKEVASTTEGDFLVLGYLFNAPGGPLLVGRMLLSAAGRETAFAILDGACSAKPDPYFLPKLPPFKVTADGKRLREQLSTDHGANELRASLITYGGKERLLNVFVNKQTEVRSVLRDILATDAGVNRVYRVMDSEHGREFLERVGEEGLGKTIAGDDLWLTAGGRKLLRKLLATGPGREAVLALVTGLY